MLNKLGAGVVLYCTALYCIILYCTVLHCTVIAPVCSPATRPPPAALDTVEPGPAVTPPAVTRLSTAYLVSTEEISPAFTLLQASAGAWGLTLSNHHLTPTLAPSLL